MVLLSRFTAATMALPLALALASAGRVDAAPRPLARLTVSAGEVARENTPVTVKLAPGLGAGKSLELRGPGEPLPVVIGPQGTATFVIGKLARGATARYELVEHTGKTEPAAAGVEVKPEASGVVITVGGKTAFHYRSQGAAPRPEIAQKFVRGGYLHPVLTPQGVQVTDDYPEDHKHHHGIWTAWTDTEYEGRTPDFWNMGTQKARKDHVALGPTFAGPSAGGFTAKLSSTDLLAKPPRIVLDEDWQVTLFRTHPKGAAPYFLFDLLWTDTLVGTSPLVLPQYRYGGLGVRGAAAWLDPAQVTFLTSEGKDRLAGDESKARWVHMGGKVGGKPVGIAVLGHPSNFRAPQPLRIHPKEPYLSVSPPKEGKFSIEAGKPYVSRYRFVVADGPVDRALLERLYEDYAHPPEITVAAP